MAIFSKFFGRTISDAAGFAVGGALKAPLDPLIQAFTNDTWIGATAAGVNIPLDVIFLAQGVAQGQIKDADARSIAAQAGYGSGHFDKAIAIANVGPGMAQAFNLWRRREIGEAGFRRALTRLGLEAEWIDDLWNVREDILDPAQLAVMIQRTVVENPDILPNQPSTAGSNVPPMPQVPINVIKEAAGSGIDKDRLSAMARIVGLPASPDLAARMHFRKIITEGAFNQAILEGNTRGEWAPFLLEGFRDILTSHDYIEAELRGWIGTDARHAGTQKHGMIDTDSDLLFKITGRPLSFHQVFIGERRGGTYDGPTTGIDPAFLKSLRESNIRPEWYNLAWAQRYSYPSAFVLRALTQNGDLTQAESEQILLFVGWEPKLATAVSTRWAGGVGASTDPLVKSATTQAITEIRSAYLIGQSDEPTVRDWLGRLGVVAATIDALLNVWNLMREVPQKGLTAAQIKKAAKSLPTQWPRARALDELQLLGLTADDAATLLDE